MFPIPIKALFLDVGGVLLTNGWDRQIRRQAIDVFHLDGYENTRKVLAEMGLSTEMPGKKRGGKP